MPEPTKTKRTNPPLCRECHHSKSFHSEAAGGKCKALGCASCKGFVDPTTGDTSPAVTFVAPAAS